MKALLIDTLARDYAFLASDSIEVWTPTPIEGSLRESEFSFDSYCHNFIIEGKIKEANPSVLIIPYSITENILEFTGLQLAHHIRLTESLGDGRFVPIVFIGSESPYTVSRLTPFANILYCEGSYWSAPKREPLQKLISIDRHLDGLLPINYEDFLKRIDIHAPSNYESHHGVDNELAMIRWAEYVGCSESVKDIENKSLTNLYFKYCLAERPFHKRLESMSLKIKGKGDVIVVDDEGEKGWYEIYSKILDYSPNISLHPLKMDFTNVKPTEVVSKTIARINDLKQPLVVIVDLRICEDDFDTEDPKALTGFQVIKAVKQVNQGIQVIVTSASNKHWNFAEALNNGALGYVFKDYQSGLVGEVRSLKKMLETGLKKAPSLKQGALLLQKLKIIEPELGQIDPDVRDNDPSWRKIKQTIEFAYLTLESNHPERLQLTLVQISRFLELLSKWFYQNRKKGDTIWKFKVDGIVKKCLVQKNRGWVLLLHLDSAVRPEVYSSLSNRVQCICVQRLGFGVKKYNNLLSDIHEIVEFRNAYLHPRKKENVTPELIRKWFGVVYQICNKLPRAV